MSVDSDSTQWTNGNNKSLNCRMYSKEYPEEKDLVVVQVKSIVDMGAFCSLLEYNGIEGMISLSQLSKRRIDSVKLSKKLIKEGRQEIVSVLRVNKEKGFIDLSKKIVSHQQVLLTEQKWNKSKAVHSIMRHVAKNTNFGVEELYQRFGWPMADRFGHAYNGLKYAMENREKFLTEFDVPKYIYAILFRNIEKRLKRQVAVIECGIECICFEIDGIIAIKKALKKGLELSTDDFVVKIKLDIAPKYILTLSTLKPKEGMERIRDVLNVILKEITKYGGYLTVKSQPKTIGFNDVRFSNSSTTNSGC